MQKFYNFIFSVIFTIFSRFPLSFRIFSGKCLGILLRLANFRKNIILRNLEIAYSRRQLPVPKAMEKRIYRHFGLLMSEIMAMPGLSDKKMLDLVSLKGKEHMDAALAQGRGVVAIGGHLGNWELCGAAFAAMGYNVNVVVKLIKGVDCEYVFHQLRGKRGVTSVLKETASIACYKALKRGEVVFFVIDQNSKKKEGVFVDFLGTSCSTYVSPAFFAHRTGAVVVPCFCRRLDDLGHHEAHFLPALELADVSKPDQQQLQQTTQLFISSLEPFYDLSPEQWIWMHKRWRSRPAGEEGFY